MTIAQTPITQGYARSRENDEIDISNECVYQLPVLNLIQLCNSDSIHSYLNLLIASAPTASDATSNVMT